MKTVLLIFVLLFCMCIGTECVKVLVVFPMPSPSHNILGTTLAKGLANASMDVTYISPFDVKDAPKNMNAQKLDGIMEWFSGTVGSNDVDLFALEHQYRIENLKVLNNIGQTLGEKFFSHKVTQKLLNSNEHFDVVILQQFWNDAMQVLGYHFKAPLIIFHTMGSSKWVNSFVGNPEPPSYVADFLVSFSNKNPTFLDRAKNLLYGIVSQANFDLIFYPAQNKILKQFYPDAPDLSQLQANVSLVLLNSHESIHPPVPHVPNLIDIGGYHVSPPKPLPNDLQIFMDNARDGVIYFSMGSNLLPSKMPKTTKEAILKVLGSRKEKVLWKWDEENLKNKPSNVKISKWFPQLDILGHPNCKLFITHGGVLSTIETVYYGVPVLAFPIFGDQKANAARAELLGFGKSLPFSSISENNLKEVMDELLENPKYRENAKYRSQIMHDRPVPPMELAVYWVNYVIRHKGAQHLRVAGTDMPYYKYFMLDVIAAIFAVVSTSYYLFYKAIRWCLKKNQRGKLKQS